MIKSEGEYWLVYKRSKNPKRCMIGIKFPSIESRCYLTLGGKRSSELYNHILLTLDTNRIEYLFEKKNGRSFVKLPWSTGLAITVFLLAVYARRKPLIYAHILDRMLQGRMPLMRYLTSMVELALELTEYFKDRQQNRLVSDASAKTVSKAMGELIKAVKL
ncbi:MAG: hypothetical protein QXL27_09420 [Candidatus Bathyarchaeia archaeon]